MKPRTAIITMAVVAAAALGVAIYVLAQAPAPRDKSGQMEYSYLTPELGLYDSNDLLVNLYPLRQQLNKDTQGKDVTMYFEFLNSGVNINLNGTPFFPGSLMKIPVAMAVMKKIESGAWTMDTTLTLTDADKNTNYGYLYERPSGTTFTVKELLDELLVQSDDTARAIFIRNLGADNIQDVLNYLGLQDIVNNQLKVTAQKYSNFWRTLYNSSYLTAEDSQELLSIMAEPHDPGLLQQGIADGVPFSHKIGIYMTTYSDSGIIYAPNRPYLLTVMMQSSSTADVQETMKAVSADIFNYVTQAPR